MEERLTELETRISLTEDLVDELNLAVYRQPVSYTHLDVYKRQASGLGLPVSTTHIAVGAVIGVGIARGIGALDLRVISGIVVSWFITVPVGALVAAGTFQILRAILS